MPKNSFIPYKMTVLKTQGMSPDTKALRLGFVNKAEAKEFTFLPGQFIFLSVLGYGEGIFALTTSPDELPEIEVAIRSVGNGTKAIQRLKVGDEIMMRGPFGKPFPLEKFYGKEALVVAGGIGLAPLRSFIHYIKNDSKNTAKLKIFVGAKTPDEFLYKAELQKWQSFAEVNLAVNNGDADWKGTIGFVTDLFDKTTIEKDAVAILCGPPVMFGPVIEKLTRKGVKEANIYVLMERRMKCGIGKCQHCTCGEKYVCIDGPTFAWSEIKDNWEALV